MLVKAMARLVYPKLTVRHNNHVSIKQVIEQVMDKVCYHGYQVSMWIHKTKINKSKMIKVSKQNKLLMTKRKIKAQKNDVSLYWG